MLITGLQRPGLTANDRGVSAVRGSGSGHTLNCVTLRQSFVPTRVSGLGSGLRGGGYLYTAVITYIR
jgi:hypothetical protein